MSSAPLNHSLAQALKIIECLWENTDNECGLTWSELDKVLKDRGIEADRRFVYSVVDGAKDTGIDLRRPHRRGSSKEKYRLASRPLEAWEIEFLTDAVSSSHALSTAEKRNLREKLSKLLSENQKRLLRETLDPMPQEQSHGNPLAPKLSDLQKAVVNGLRVKFAYSGPTDLPTLSSKVELVEPWAFAVKNDTLLLVGAKVCEDGLKKRAWRLDRMRELVVTESLCLTCAMSARTPIADLLSQNFDLNLSNKPVEVELSFDPRFACEVAERFGDDKVDESRTSARVSVVPSQGFYAWVFSFSGGVSIASPDAVRQGFEDALLESASRTLLRRG